MGTDLNFNEYVEVNFTRYQYSYVRTSTGIDKKIWMNIPVIYKYTWLNLAVQFTRKRFVFKVVGITDPAIDLAIDTKEDVFRPRYLMFYANNEQTYMLAFEMINFEIWPCPQGIYMPLVNADHGIPFPVATLIPLTN